MAEPLPGHLSRAELAELIGPVSHFHLFALDDMQPHYAWNRRPIRTDAGVVMVFNFTRGSGRALIGEPDERIALLELAGGHTFSHFRIERVSLLQKLRELFGETGPGAEHLTPSLREQISAHAIDVDIEGDGRWVAFSRRGAVRDGEHEAFAREISPLAAAFSALARSG